MRISRALSLSVTHHHGSRRIQAVRASASPRLLRTPSSGRKCHCGGNQGLLLTGNRVRLPLTAHPEVLPQTSIDPSSRQKRRRCGRCDSEICPHSTGVRGLEYIDRSSLRIALMISLQVLSDEQVSTLVRLLTSFQSPILGAYLVRQPQSLSCARSRRGHRVGRCTERCSATPREGSWTDG